MSKRGHDVVTGDEATTSQRGQLADGNAIAGDNEGLALVETTRLQSEWNDTPTIGALSSPASVVTIGGRS